MLFCLCLVALLLYDTVFASAACSQTFDKAPGKIEAVSTHYHHLGRRKCVYLIRAPLDFSISLNFTDIFGFIPSATAVASTETSTNNGTNLGSAGILSTSSPVASVASKDRHHHQTRYRHPHSVFETNRSSSEAENLSSQPVPTVTLITGPIRRGQCRLPQVEIVEENEVSGDKVVMGKICRSSHGNQLLLLVSGDENQKNASVAQNSTSVDAMLASSAMTSNTPPQKVFHSVAHTLKLVYEWGLNPHLSGFSLEFNFQHKPVATFGINKSGPCEFTCADSRCLSSWSMVCDGAEDCVDRSDEHDCPYHNSRLPTAQGTSRFGTAEVSSFQIVLIVIAVVLAVGVIAFMVSHYKMGARSWSDRWTRTSSQQVPQTGQSHHHQQQQQHQHHSHPSPQHHRHYHNNHLDHNTSTTTAYVQSPDERLSHEVALLRERQIRLQSVQTDLELALPPSISLPDGEEYPYDSLQHLHLRNTDQENEILRECIRPPPNRTIFESESPPPYRACSMSTLHSSSSSTFSLMSASTNNGALRVRSADYSSPLVMRCHSMSSNNCNCGHHQASSGVGGGGGSSGRNATPVPQHLRIARLVNSRLSTAVSSTSLPASITSNSSSSFCSFCDPPTATASSTFPVNHYCHRCPNGTICTNSSGCCACCPSKAETHQQRSVTSNLSGNSSGNSVVGARSGGGSSSSHEISQVPGASAANTRVTDCVNGVRHHPVTLSLTVNSRDVVAGDRNHSCRSGDAFGDESSVEPGGDCADQQWNDGGGQQTKIL